MDINKRTFCAAPWFSVRNENSGEYRACCQHSIEQTEFPGRTKYNSNDSMESWLNSDYMQYLRKELVHGNQVSECQQCWVREDEGLTSLRQTTNSMVTNNRAADLDNTWIPVYFKIKTDYLSDLLLMADIKINNVCNFSCAMCEPRDSSLIYSKWIDQPANEFVLEYTKKNPEYFIEIKDAYQIKNGIQILDEVLNHPIKVLKILGGEPLLNPKLLQRLTEIPASHRKKIDLVFVTNGSVDLEKVSKQLTGFGSIYYIVSAEATGAVQDYIRRGSNWVEIEQNIDNFLNYKQICTDQINIEIHSTIQALNILHYADLSEWCKIRNIKHTITFLQMPDYLSLSVLTEELKQRAIAIIKGLTINSDVQGLLSTLAETKYDPALVEKFVRFIKWYDPALTLLDIDSTWQEFFN
jgi:organic radical activating enzyme